MEKLLQNLRRIQDECLKQMEQDSQKKLPRNVCGVLTDGPSLNNKAWETTKEMILKLKRIKSQETPSQIVIEKRFFLRCLGLIGGFYLFRPADSIGTVFFRTDESYLENRPKSFPGWLLTMSYIMLIASVLGVFGFSLLSTIIALTSLLAGIFLEKSKSKYRKEIEVWKNNFLDNPNLLLNGVYSKEAKYETYDGYQLLKEGYSRALLRIEFSNSLWSSHQQAINNARDKAQETKGRLTWLWQYGKITTLRDKFSVTHDENGDAILAIEIETSGPNLLPVVETEEAFIFNLKHFRFMERYFVEDEINNAIEKTARIIRSEKNAGRYDWIFP